MRKARQGGFTILELMFTVIVAAVLLAIGVPGFRDFMRNSRMTATANDLLADYNLARSEAVKRRVPVTVCKSADGTNCDTSDTTSFNRWIVFVDDANPLVSSADDGNGARNTGEAILRDQAAGDDVNGTATGRYTIYQRTGFPLTTAAGNLSQVVFCDPRGSVVTSGAQSAARGFTVTPTGRAAVTREQDLIEDLGGCPE